MDEQRLLKACELVDKGKYSEAHIEFIQLAENTPEPLEKAWPLIYAANTLQTLGEQEAATVQLSAARNLIERHRPSISARDERFAAVECFLDFVDANLLWLRGGNQEAALNRFDAALKKHRLALKDPRSRGLHEAFQIRRAFILADLGRWKEAMPILEGIKSPQEYREGIAFYLGHCYLSGDELSIRGRVREGKRQIDRSLKAWPAQLPRVSRALRTGNDLLQSQRLCQSKTGT